MKTKLILTFCIMSGLMVSCSQKDTSDKEVQSISEEFNNYWYDGKAEISSYKLRQARYGEVRDGEAVLIYVTEPFSKKSFTKADNPSRKDPSVLKLNFTKSFLTGIYPYSIMTSIFSPINSVEHALKVSTSIQEWCGHTYMELIKKDDYNIGVMCYFEGEQYDHHEEITHLEDEIWTLLRINPDRLPIGEVKMIPAFSYLRLTHQETRPYSCNAILKSEDSKSVYSMDFAELDRFVEIEFESTFPYQILGWEETYPCVGCETKENLSSSATLIETIKTDYWNENSNSDTSSRIQLGLPY